MPSRALDPRRWLLVLGALLVLLAATGLWQERNYRSERVPPPSSPAATQTWEDIYTLQDPQYRGAGWVSAAHRSLAMVFVLVALGLVVLLITRWARRGRANPFVIGLLTVGGLAIWGAFHSGHELPYAGLALWAVKVPTGLDGLWDVAFDPVVRFVFTSEGETTPAAYRTDMVAHLIAVPVILVVVLGFVRRHLRADDIEPAEPTDRQ